MSSESALDIAADVRAGRRTVVHFAERSLARIRKRDGAIGASGGDPGPLAGVPYAFKDLFDVKGLSTTAGAGMLHDAPPARRDAEAIEWMREAGAVSVATCNMDEYAYGLATINVVLGATKIYVISAAWKGILPSVLQRRWRREWSRPRWGRTRMGRSA